MRINKKYLFGGLGAAALLYYFPKIKAQFAQGTDKPEQVAQSQTTAPAPTPSTPKNTSNQPVTQQKTEQINVLGARQHEITAIAIAIKDRFYFGSIKVPDREYITRQINALKSVSEARYLGLEFKRISGRKLGEEINRFFSPSLLERINASYKNQF